MRDIRRSLIRLLGRSEVTGCHQPYQRENQGVQFPFGYRLPGLHFTYTTFDRIRIDHNARMVFRLV